MGTDFDETLTPYQKGRAEAWLSPVTRNPYDRNTDAEREWYQGWQDAKDERIAALTEHLERMTRHATMPGGYLASDHLDVVTARQLTKKPPAALG